MQLERAQPAARQRARAALADRRPRQRQLGQRGQRGQRICGRVPHPQAPVRPRHAAPVKRPRRLRAPGGAGRLARDANGAHPCSCSSRRRRHAAHSGHSAITLTSASVGTRRRVSPVAAARAPRCAPRPGSSGRLSMRSCRCAARVRGGERARWHALAGNRSARAGRARRAAMPGRYSAAPTGPDEETCSARSAASAVTAGGKGARRCSLRCCRLCVQAPGGRAKPAPLGQNTARGAGAALGAAATIHAGCRAAGHSGRGRTRERGQRGQRGACARARRAVCPNLPDVQLAQAWRASAVSRCAGARGRRRSCTRAGAPGRPPARAPTSCTSSASAASRAPRESAGVPGSVRCVSRERRVRQVSGARCGASTVTLSVSDCARAGPASARRRAAPGRASGQAAAAPRRAARRGGPRPRLELRGQAGQVEAPGVVQAVEARDGQAAQVAQRGQRRQLRRRLEVEQQQRPQAGQGGHLRAGRRALGHRAPWGARRGRRVGRTCASSASPVR